MTPRPKNSQATAESKVADTWIALEAFAARWAAACLKKWGGSLDREERDGIARDAVAVALQGDPLGGHQAKEAVVRLVSGAVRNATRAAGNCQPAHDVDLVTTTRIRSGQASKLRSLGSRAARQLCGRLEDHERRLEQAIDGGSLWRHPEYESSIYRRLFEDIVSLSRREKASAGPSRQLPNVDARVAALISWRSQNITVRCQLCAPGVEWVECSHTIPRFEGGKRVAGVDLRARGRRKERMNLLFKFGSPSYVDDASKPPANYSAQYLRQDAAARLVSEALRLSGIHSSVRHVLEDERGIELGRQISSVLAEFEPTTDGELREKASAPQAWVAPGARCRAQRRASRQSH